MPSNCGSEKSDQHYGRFEFLERRAQRLFGFDTAPRTAQAIALQLVELALHVHVEILDKEHSN